MPSWVTAVKAAPGSSQPASSATTRRCALLLIGRNSVSPWTTPSTAASNHESTSYSPSPDSSSTSASVRSAATRSSSDPAYDATDSVVTPASA